MQQLAGKTAFITGGASGIGFGMAETFAARQMKVAIADVAILDDDCYVITHPEFPPLVEERLQALLADFKESADPDLPLDPDWMPKT